MHEIAKTLGRPPLSFLYAVYNKKSVYSVFPSLPVPVGESFKLAGKFKMIEGQQNSVALVIKSIFL